MTQALMAAVIASNKREGLTMTDFAIDMMEILNATSAHPP
jgi:hypothetical protein